MSEKAGYSDALNPDRQACVEELIAKAVKERQLFLIAEADENGSDDETFTDEDCGDVGREALYLALREFRADLFDDAAGADRLALEESASVAVFDVLDLENHNLEFRDPDMIAVGRGAVNAMIEGLKLFQAAVHAETLASLIDGQDDELSEMLSPVREFLASLAAVAGPVGVSSGEIGHAGGGAACGGTGTGS